MGPYESLLWETPSLHVLKSRRPRFAARLEGSTLREWTARPLGRLGRPLVDEIEAYLEFFAIARADDAEGSAR